MSEPGKALPDQVTSRRLLQAYIQVVRFCRHSGVDSSFELAQVLQGISRAVSDIVFARGKVEVGKLNGRPFTNNIVRKFENPDTKLGRMFVGQPDRGYGASLGLYVIKEAPGQSLLYGVSLPSDHAIDQLLLQEPVLWSELNAYAEHYQKGSQYPFSNEYYRAQAAQQYFLIAKQLCRLLLRVTR